MPFLSRTRLPRTHAFPRGAAGRRDTQGLWPSSFYYSQASTSTHEVCPQHCRLHTLTLLTLGEWPPSNQPVKSWDLLGPRPQPLATGNIVPGKFTRFGKRRATESYRILFPCHLCNQEYSCRPIYMVLGNTESHKAPGRYYLEHGALDWLCGQLSHLLAVLSSRMVS